MVAKWFYVAKWGKVRLIVAKSGGKVAKSREKWWSVVKSG